MPQLELGVSACAIFLVIGVPQSLEVIGNYFGGYTEQVVTSLSLADHFDTLTRGLVELRSLAFFAVATVGWLAGGMIMLNQVKAS